MNGLGEGGGEFFLIILFTLFNCRREGYFRFSNFFPRISIYYNPPPPQTNDFRKIFLDFPKSAIILLISCSFWPNFDCFLDTYLKTFFMNIFTVYLLYVLFVFISNINVDFCENPKWLCHYAMWDHFPIFCTKSTDVSKILSRGICSDPFSNGGFIGAFHRAVNQLLRPFFNLLLTSATKLRAGQTNATFHATFVQHCCVKCCIKFCIRLTWMLHDDATSCNMLHQRCNILNMFKMLHGCCNK